MHIKDQDIFTSTHSHDICSKCRGSGFVRVWKSTDETVAVYGDGRKVEFLKPCPDCQGNLRGRAETNSRLANIPGRFTASYQDSFSWEVYNQETEIQQKVVGSFIRDFSKWKKRGKGLYIYSRTTGTGKTHLSCILANELIFRYGLRCQFINTSEILDMVKKADREQTENPLLKLYDTDFLILDDLGAKKGNSWLDDCLFKICDRRLNDGSITCFTSNVKMHDLGGKGFSDRVIDRIYRMATTLTMPEVPIRELKESLANKQFLVELGILSDG